MKFKTWLDKVDDYVYEILNLRLKDLPDEDFWVHWNNKVDYKIMAEIIIKDQTNFIDFIS